jgi:outer membrane protein assembly factor BamE (lipoprotein component of BamABCDE complex)
MSTMFASLKQASELQLRTTMKTFRFLLIGAILAGMPAHSQNDDEKVLYLTELSQPPLKSTVLKDTPLNLTRASNTYMTYLPRGQVVEILAIARYQLQVRGKMRTGSVQGWVHRSDVAAIPDDVISEMKDKISDQKKFDEAVKRKEVIFGMTQDQVRMVLGKPADKSSIQEEDGTTEVWSYYTYRSVPVMESYGYGTNVVTQTFTQKIRTGSKTISFRDGKVVRIEQKTEQGTQVPGAYPMTPIVIPKSSY